MGVQSAHFFILGPGVRVDAVTRGVEEAVRSLAADAVRETGAELVDMEYRREPVGWVLRLYIDKSGGVSLADCQRVSEIVGTLLEVENPIPHAYTLEVSSPGLTRPLQSEGDWKRAVGSMVKVVTREAVAGRQDFVGMLSEAGPDKIRLVLDGTDMDVPRDLIVRARREVEWPRAGGGAGRGSSRKKRGA